MRKTIAAVVAAAALLGAGGAAPAEASPIAQAAHRCSSGYVHAKTPAGHKCLRAGQYCSRKRRYRRIYKRKGFVCKRGRLRER